MPPDRKPESNMWRCGRHLGRLIMKS